jgi:hypothetical protein
VYSNLEALRNFIKRQVKVGHYTKGSGQSYLTSIDAVFALASEKDKADVLKVDLDRLLIDFREAAKRSGLGDNTSWSYVGRVKAAIAGFDLHVQRPVPAAHSESSENGAMEPLRMPLRPGVTVYIEGLPFDLTALEARRLGSVLEAMVRANPAAGTSR